MQGRRTASKALYMVTLGCPKNRVDSEVMLGALLPRGYALVQAPEEADVIVVNTCGFVRAAEKESVDAILELAEFKKKGRGRCSLLVVAGCLVQRHREALVQALPEVDCFLGTGEYLRLLEIEASPPQPPELPSRINSMPWYTAYLKIAEGCDNTCAFCIIPKLRGPQRSRPMRDIVREAHALVGQGVKEINLVAQDLTAYGYDLPGRPRLHELLVELARLDVCWIRMHYAYPRVLPAEFIAAMASQHKIAKYLDVPFQHASDKLLRAMGRGGDAAFLRQFVQRLRAAVPGLTLRTAFIVGFPGETEEDFETLVDFVQAMRFERLGVFQYSDEVGTAAHALGDKVPQRTIARRWRQLMAIQRHISEAANQKLVGKRLEVLVEGVSPETDLLLVGRHQGQAPEVDGQVYINEGVAAPGEFVAVEVTQAHAYDVVGRVVAPHGGR